MFLFWEAQWQQTRPDKDHYQLQVSISRPFSRACNQEQLARKIQILDSNPQSWDFSSLLLLLSLCFFSFEEAQQTASDPTWQTHYHLQVSISSSYWAEGQTGVSFTYLHAQYWVWNPEPSFCASQGTRSWGYSSESSTLWVVNTVLSNSISKC